MGYAATIDDITLIDQIPYDSSDDRKQTTIISFDEKEPEKLYKNINKSSNTSIIDFLRSLPYDLYNDIDETLGLSESIKLLDFINNSYTYDMVESIDRLTTERIELLARKYVRESMTLEDKARLDIINERLDNLLPLVTELELSKIEKTNNMIIKFNKKLSKRIKKFKLD